MKLYDCLTRRVSEIVDIFIFDDNGERKEKWDRYGGKGTKERCFETTSFNDERRGSGGRAYGG